MSEITVYGKLGCGLCEAAKKKLELMHLEYTSENIQSKLDHHEGWRTDKSCDVASIYYIYNTLPVILVDGKAMTYPQTMRFLKERKSNG